MSPPYYSDRNSSPKPRTCEEISPRLWRALVALIDKFIENDYLSFVFPKNCSDGNALCGTNRQVCFDIILGQFPNIQTWPPSSMRHCSPDSIMDVIEFIYHRARKPLKEPGDWHDYGKHFHIGYSDDSIRIGKMEFKNEINELFKQNLMVHELQEDGKIIRLLPSVLSEMMEVSEFNTTDELLNTQLRTAKIKFASRDCVQRKEALEKIWDAFERIKTIMDPRDKQRSAKALLEKVSSEPQFNISLTNEMRAMSDIGNDFCIRHFETNRTTISDHHHIDYLFFRMYSLLNLLLTQIPQQSTHSASRLGEAT